MFGERASDVIGEISAIGPGCVEKNVGTVRSTEADEWEIVLRPGSEGSRYQIEFSTTTNPPKLPLRWVTDDDGLMTEEIIGYLDHVGDENLLFVLSRPAGEGRMILKVPDEMDVDEQLTEGWLLSQPTAGRC